MTKFCKDCKHFSIGPIRQLFTDIQFGKCMMHKYSLTEDQKAEYMVTGDTANTQYFYATTARSASALCGPNATDFVKR